jgi:hypothetical protein
MTTLTDFGRDRSSGGRMPALTARPPPSAPIRASPSVSALRSDVCCVHKFRPAWDYLPDVGSTQVALSNLDNS